MATVSFFTVILRNFYDIFMTVRDAPAIFLPAAGVVATGGVSAPTGPCSDATDKRVVLHK
jgi:hypothetical protein